MDKNEYQTNDLCLATYLVTVDTPLLNTKLDTYGNTVFCFERTSNLDELINKFLTLQARVEPLSFFASEKRLKHLIYHRR